MLLRSLLPSVALALTANAFLVPPHIADKATISLDEALNNADITEIFRQDEVHSVNLQCNSCRVVFPDDKSKTGVNSKHAKTSIRLDFRNSNNVISVNNVNIYPTDIKEISKKPMITWQTTEDPAVTQYFPPGQGKTPLAALSYSMDVVSEVPFKDAVSTALVFQILGVNDEVADIGAVAVGILKKPDGTLILHSVNQISSTMSPAAKQCTTLLCRVKATIADKINAFRTAAASKWASLRGGCARYMGGKATGGRHPGKAHGHGKPTGHRGPHVKGGPGKYIGRFPPNNKNGEASHPPHHHHHHHQSTFRKVVHIIHKVFRHVILPVMIGVGAGMAASAIGMLVGQMICMLWMRFRGSRSTGYAPVEQLEIVEEEGRLSGESLPPKYEDVEGHLEVIDEKEEQQ